MTMSQPGLGAQNRVKLQCSPHVVPKLIQSHTQCKLAWGWSWNDYSKRELWAYPVCQLGSTDCACAKGWWESCGDLSLLSPKHPNWIDIQSRTYSQNWQEGRHSPARHESGVSAYSTGRTLTRGFSKQTFTFMAGIFLGDGEPIPRNPRGHCVLGWYSHDWQGRSQASLCSYRGTL